MRRVRSRSADSDQSVDIVKRRPRARAQIVRRSSGRSTRLTVGLKLVNPFKSNKPTIHRVRQESPQRRVRRRASFDERWEEGSGTDNIRAEPMCANRNDDFVPLPPPIPPFQQDFDPIVQVVEPRSRQRPRVYHHPRSRSSHMSPHRSHHEPEVIFEPERTHRRDAERTRQERQRRREAEAEAERVREAALRERDRRRRAEADLRQAEDLTQRMERVAIQERENARRAAADAEEADALARRAEQELNRERRERVLAERERAVLERHRAREREERAEAEAEARRRRPLDVEIIQRNFPMGLDRDRGADVIRQAQETERRRREDDRLRRHGADRDRDGRRPPIDIFDDDDDIRWRPRHR